MSEKDKPTVLLEYYLKKLRLPTMLREYASMAAICQKDRTDFPTYLLRLVEIGCQLPRVKDHRHIRFQGPTLH
jgi:hypothetical protein